MIPYLFSVWLLVFCTVLTILLYYWIDFICVSCYAAVDGGVQAVVIAAGSEYGIIERILVGDKAGTAFFLGNGHDDALLASPEGQGDAGPVHIESIPHVPAHPTAEAIEQIAVHAREGGRQLNQVPEDTRRAILLEIAGALKVNEAEILKANALDLEIATKR